MSNLTCDALERDIFKNAMHWNESTFVKPFVGVRIAEIQSTWSFGHWRFVPTKLNPADDLSRGLRPHEMNGRWINGPDFLRKPREEWPTVTKVVPPEDDVERKKPRPVCATVKVVPPIDVKRFSNWGKLTRVTAYVLRFVHNLNCGRKAIERKSGPLNPEEMERARLYTIKSVQRQLENWRQLKDLAPFSDDQGIIRVGGRLRHAPLTYDQKHPILLPASSHVSKLVMGDGHEKMSHPGSERTLCESRRRYWILKGRSLARETVKNCVICRILRQPPHTTLMGNLPVDRLKLFAPPYSTTGVDLFGPFLLKCGRNKSVKAWGAIFTCATVRAVHLEIVETLSTTSFLHALRRFVAHHGWPSTIISDNGTNFGGAEKELRKLVIEGRKQIEDFAVLHHVKWRFITPLSPHQGGFYESLIKQVKGSLRVAIGQQLLTWNEMSTAFAEVQSLVNSRPIGYSSNDPNDLQPLTPNHFLIGRASTAIPQGPFEAESFKVVDERLPYLLTSNNAEKG
ncbi:PREDICTED: uncharacterized protein LOC106817603 [Priapulus caudatus]|uniref:Uncharacterized protein LOC106817603 n=1 Tax=Priapulus caudatus TaxID=37621 RepID=A0ABM1EZZ7_PRICU|nr:PREDICTED: uncharacterized protein LOC106817603 [Priapulus caudatus]